MIPTTGGLSWTRRAIVLGAVAAVTGAASGSRATAQQVVSDTIPTTFLESLRIDLVEVEVFVTDSKGTVVTGLTERDFRLLEDGRKVDIEHFAWIAPTTPPDAAAADAVDATSAAPIPTETAAAEPGRVVFFLDGASLPAAARHQAVDSLVRFVGEDLDDGIEVAVAAYDGAFSMPLTFTVGRAEAQEALRSVAQPSALGLLRQRERESTAIESLELLRRIRDLSRSPVRRTEVPRYFGAVSRQIEAQARRIREQSAGSLYALSHVVNALGTLPGRKALVYVGAGMPMRPGAELHEALSEAVRTTGPIDVDVTDGESRDAEIARRSAVLGAVEEASPRRSREVGEANRDLALLAALANASGVTFYPFRPEGHIGGSLPELAGGAAELATPQYKSLRQANLVDTLRFLSDRSGGVTAVGGDVSDVVAQARADFGGRYSLAFTPRATDDGEIHDLEVKVKGRGLRVRHRASYLAKPPAIRLADRASTAMLFGIEDNPLDLSIAIGRQEATDHPERVIVPLSLRIPLGNLVLAPEEGVHATTATLFIAAMAPDGQLAPVQEAQLKIAVPEDRLANVNREVHATRIELLMRPGPQRVAIGFVDPATGLTSYVSRDVDVRAAE